MSTRPSAAKTQWQPTIPVDQSIYEGSSTIKAPLGTRLEVGDRVFYYAQIGTSANVAGDRVVTSVQMYASHQADILTPIATSAGAKGVTITLGEAVTLNQYRDGYLIISSGTGVGTTYRIKSHTAVASAGNVVINLYDELADVMTTGEELNLLPNQYASCKVGSEALDVPIGVTPVAVTTGEYFWLQTYGPCGVDNVAATPAAVAVRLGTLGSVIACRASTEGGGATSFEIGKNYPLAGTAAESTPIFLTIRP